MFYSLQKNFLSLSTLYVFLITLFFSILFSNIAFAAEFSPLVGIPGLDVNTAATIPQYVNAVYTTLIVIGSLVAVMRIAWAGVKYSLSGVVTDKESAKHDIQGVLMGLAILLLPFVVLNTINPNLVNLDVLRMTQPVTLGTAGSKLSARQEADRVKCQAKGLDYSADKGDCATVISEADDIRERRRLCEGYDSGNIFTPPNTCAPRPAVDTIVATIEQQKAAFAVTNKCAYGQVDQALGSGALSCRSGICPAGTHYDKNSIAPKGCAKD